MLNKRGAVAVFEIKLLVLASISVAFLIGAQTSVVMAIDNFAGRSAYDTNGTYLGVTNEEGYVIDAKGKRVGALASDGGVYALTGNQLIGAVPTLLTGGKQFTTIKDVPASVFASVFESAKLETVTGDFQKDLLGTEHFGKVLSDFTTVPESWKGTPYYQEGMSVKQREGGGFEFTYKDKSKALISAAGVVSGVAAPREGKLLGVIPVRGAFLSHLAEGVTWAAAAAGAIQLFAGVFGATPEMKNSLTYAAIGGIMTWKTIAGLKEKGIASKIFGKDAFLGKHAGLAGLAVAAAIFVLTYKKQEQKLIRFECKPWEPVLGGASCERCNEDPFRPCSEYRCKSLGQACEIVNPGTEDEKCVWVSPDDVTSPEITPFEDVLTPGLKYTNVKTRPPSLGMQIVSDTVCLPAFTDLRFGLLTNEPAQCKIDIENKPSFEEMDFFFGDNNLHLLNHTHGFRLPSPNADGVDVSQVLGTDGRFTYYVRCQDANGNVNEDNFAVSFCIDESPDTTPPVIEQTSFAKGVAVQFEVDEVPVRVFVNEPAECRWSRIDKAYEDMEHGMSCSSETIDMNAQLLYTCAGNVTGIQDRMANEFFFRCEDQPGKPEGERNVNVQSFSLVLQGSQPLNILQATPSNETLIGATQTQKVELFVRTDDGADEGRAICAFSPTGSEGSFITFFKTNSHEHRQNLDLVSGNYLYTVRCVDAGGNAAETVLEFTVDLDEEAPVVTRVYKEQDGLKVITNEPAECRYSQDSCNFVFAEGLAMVHNPASATKVSFAKWTGGQSYYVKCRDTFGNEPSPNACSVVVGATNLN